MRKKTREMLGGLVSTNTKAALLAFWSDLKKLDREQFETAINPKPAKRVLSKKNKTKTQPDLAPTTDGPIDRIKQLLLVQCSLEPAESALALREQLARQRISASRIPPYNGGDFGAWLSELFKGVPSSKVLHAAVSLSAGTGAIR